MRRRNQQMEAFCTAWLKIIGYMVDVNRDALQVYLLTIHCVDTSGDANGYIHAQTSSSETSISISLSVPREVC